MVREREEMEAGLAFAPISSAYDPFVAELVRSNLKAYHLDIPGTAYFDESLDRLSLYYDRPGRAYDVLLKDGAVSGGVGLAECGAFSDCCEMQKLYLADSAKGRGLGYRLIERVETRALEMGYRRMYLETHSALRAAIHLYQISGFREIPKPPGVIHSAMDRFFLKEL